MKVDIYRNLNIPNDDPCKWSVLDRSNRKVIDRVQTAHVKDVEFVVQPAGRKRVLEEQRKNVHAFIRGDLTDDRFMAVGLVKVIYNPYTHDHFIRTDTGEPIYEWDHVLFTIHGAYIGTDSRTW